ncbi:hypothetical protein HU200_045983 [Digitaria exilis]|uniref:Uncharacterized protein n=1 Tax=Digitaria exilis TaxID=1010633 RepID=A0A835E9W4_9POAL|nr:hypothetical protein HU200_045983 [Digitaria exilis]
MDGEAASLARRLLPPFVTVTDYVGRVMLLETGVEKEDCDAALVAQFLESELDLKDHLEAVIVHRFSGAIFLVLSSREDAQMLLQVPEAKWARAFGRPAVCQLVQTKATQQQLPPAPLQLHLDLNHWMSPTAMEILRLTFTNELYAINDHDSRGLTRRLIGLAALSQPHALRRDYFPDRAVLLTEIDLGTSLSDLWTALARYGSLDEVVHVRHRGVALVIFTS